MGCSTHFIFYRYEILSYYNYESEWNNGISDFHELKASENYYRILVKYLHDDESNNYTLIDSTKKCTKASLNTIIWLHSSFVVNNVNH